MKFDKFVVIVVLKHIKACIFIYFHVLFPKFLHFFWNLPWTRGPAQVPFQRYSEHPVKVQQRMAILCEFPWFFHGKIIDT